MTHNSIMQFTTEEGETYILVTADSQANYGDREKYGYFQKLFKRGRSFVTGAGDGNALRTIAYRLERIGEDVKAEEVAEDVLSTYKKLPDAKDTVVYICGETSSGIKSLHLELKVNSSEATQLDEVTMALDGSAKKFTAPLIEALFNNGHFRLERIDIAEALLLNYRLGQIAEMDAGVNNRSQIGITNGKIFRPLYHPEVRMTDFDRRMYYRCAVGAELPNIPVEEELPKEFMGLGATLNDLHTDLHIQAARLHRSDLEANMTNMQLKIKSSEENFAKYRKALDKREETKKELTSLASAWVKGDIVEMVGVLTKFNDKREEFYREATKLKTQA